MTLDNSQKNKEQMLEELVRLKQEIDRLNNTYSKNSFFDLYQNSPDMLFSVHPGGEILRVNQTACNLLGYSFEELLGSSVWKIVHKDDLRDVRKRISEQLKRKVREGNLSFRKVRSDGSVIFVEEKTQLLFDEQENVAEIRIACRDVSLRKTVEEKLRRQEERYRKLIDNLNVGLYRSTADEAGSFVEVNRAFLKMFGFRSKKDLFSCNVNSLYVNKKDRKNFIEKIRKAGLVKNQEITFKKKNGDYFYGSLSAISTTNNKGKTVYFDGFVEDITDRKKATEELVNKEKRYRTLFEFSPNGIIIEDAVGTILDVNPAFCELMQLKRDELIGKNVDELAHPSKKKNVKQNIKKILSGEKLSHVELNIRKDGSVIYVQLNERKFLLPDGSPGIISMVSDITDQKMAQEVVANSEESYRGLFNSANDAIYIQDRNGVFLDVNEGALKMYGYTRDQMIGKTPEFVSAPGKNDIENVALKIRKAFNGQPQIFEFWGIDNKGRIFPKEVRVNKGTYFGKEVVVAFAQDITQRLLTEEKIKESERRLSTLMSNLPGMAYRCKNDTNWTMEFVSQGCYELTGYHPDELIANRIIAYEDIIHPDDRKRVWNSIQEAFSEQRPFQLVYRIFKKSGELMWVWEQGTGVDYQNQKFHALEGFISNITERILMEEELMIAKEKAEESDRLKSAFLANMSHEIRTPMNSIIGFSQLIDDLDISQEERYRYVNMIQNSGNDLLNIIDDIIDISKIEAGQMKIFKAQHNLHEVLRETHIFFRDYLKTNPKKKEVEILYTPPKESEDCLIYTDIDRFKQILRNLLSNAIKFTEKGFVELGFNVHHTGKERCYTFFVKDTGLGIPPEKTELIFNPFTQAIDSSSRLYGGTGLGLTITKKIVEILGGRIWVESELGKGSVFYFTHLCDNKPMVADKGFSDQNTSAFLLINWSGKSILIVEDDDSSYHYFDRVLKRTNIRIERAEDGLQAIKLCNDERFNLVFMDIRLPEMDGLKAMYEIKAKHKSIPVIAQTAFAMQGEREKYLKAGFDDYISKPIKMNDLIEIVGRYVDNKDFKL